MTPAVDRIASALEQINERLTELEHRVAALETQAHPTQVITPAAPAITVRPVERTQPPPTWRGFPPPRTSGGTVPTLGKAVLALAGAYLLRAIAESSSIPHLPVVAVAILYACAWMLWSVRLRSTSPTASVTYAITSTLILSPLLWESTIRFQTLSPAVAGLVLVAYVVLMLVLTWRFDLQVIPWVTMLAAVSTTLALVIATHALVPLTATLLLMALALEIVACLGRPLIVRVLPALAIDLAILLLIDIMTSSDGVPPGYAPASPGTLLFVFVSFLMIYGVSIGVRGFVQREPIGVFDIAQGVLAFALATFGALRVTRNAAAALGVLYLLLAAACYWGTFSRFTAKPDRRNRIVAAVWSPALLLAGALLLFPATVQVILFSAAGLVVALLYTRNGDLVLGVHASLYLAIAAVVSPEAGFVVSSFAGTIPAAPPWAVWIVIVSAALVYLQTWRSTYAGKRRILWLLPALLVSFSAAALIIVSAAHVMAGGAQLSAPRLSVIRTVVNCALALALAFLGSRWKRAELGWIAYAAVAFGTLKFLFEDLRFGNASSLVFSLLFYGLILILLPRFLQRSRPEEAKAAPAGNSPVT